jgi:hypothetical protein
VTVFDLLFIVSALTGIATLIVACIKRSLGIVGKLGAGIVVYVVMVYSATLFSRPVITQQGEPQCSDDWCIAVDRVSRTGPQIDVALRILSRARRVTQRELSATDVYLVDDQWRRYDPIPEAGDIPLNTLLQPGETIATRRSFHVPPGVHVTGLKVGGDRGPGSICLVIGECDAFHKGRMIALRIANVT